MDHRHVDDDSLPAPAGAYSPVVRIGPFVQTSGQLPVDASTGQVVLGDIEAQTVLSLTNVQAALEAAGASWAHVLSLRVFLRDDADFERFDASYAAFVPQPWPARTTIGAELAPGALIEIDALAVVTDDAP